VVDRQRRDELIARFELDPTKKARTYSKGNRQKVALVAALAADAELLILDEPTGGLDPLMEAVFPSCVQGGRDEEGGAHRAAVQPHPRPGGGLCDRVTIIRRGRAVQSGSLSELRHLTRTTAQIVVGVVLAFWFVVLGYPVVGSVALAAATAAVGLVFAGVTAVSAQLASSSRAAIGLSATLLAGAFVIRAVGDIGGNVMSWLSPFGWGFGMRAFADEQWWPLAVSVAVTVGLVALSFWLSTRRDLGSGLLPQRAGPERAAGWLTNPLGLALRLRRGSLIAWPVGLFLTGVTFGSIGDDIDQMLEDNPAMADFITLAGDATPTDAYFAVAMTMLALITGGLAISVALGPRSEEGAGRADLVLAGPVRRARWAGSHVVIAVVGTIVSLLASGLGVGVGYALIVGDTSQVARLTAAALVTLPAVLAMLGATVALYGWFPRWALLAWGLLAFVGVVGYLGEVLQLPRWVRDLSPFERLPAVPAEDMTFAPLAVLTVIAGGLTTLGLWGLGRRDVDVH
jgi:ABC-2 type transport system permease protein